MKGTVAKQNFAAVPVLVVLTALFYINPPLSASDRKMH